MKKSELRQAENAALQINNGRRKMDLRTYEGFNNYINSTLRRLERMSSQQISLSMHYIGCVGKWSSNNKFRQSMKAVKHYMRLVREDSLTVSFGLIKWDVLRCLGYVI